MKNSEQPQTIFPHEYAVRLGEGADRLSPREREVLYLMAVGDKNREIAEELSISMKTVEAHRARIFYKLSARNIAECICRAFAAGVLRIEFPAQEGAEQ